MEESKAALLIFIFTSMLAACTTVTGRDSKEQLLRLDGAWSTVATQGKDIDRIVSFWTDDATVIPPGAPAIWGKPAIRAFVQESLATPGFRISWRPDHAALSADGTLGYTMGENTLSFPGPDGRIATTAGRYVTVWRRSPGGAWKCVIDIWNSATP